MTIKSSNHFSKIEIVCFCYWLTLRYQIDMIVRKSIIFKYSSLKSNITLKHTENKYMKTKE